MLGVPVATLPSAFAFLKKKKKKERRAPACVQSIAHERLVVAPETCTIDAILGSMQHADHIEIDLRAAMRVGMRAGHASARRWEALGRGGSFFWCRYFCTRTKDMPSAMPI